MAEAMNYQSCCRLCLSERMDSLQSIFGETPNDPDLTKKILQHLNIEVSKFIDFIIFPSLLLLN